MSKKSYFQENFFYNFQIGPLKIGTGEDSLNMLSFQGQG